MFVTRGNTLVQIGTEKTVVSDAKGDWFVSFTAAELAELALDQPENFSAYFEARTSKSDQVSQPSKMEFQVVRSVPALLGDWVKFDANGDGANNDGLELSLTDAVLVRDLIADLKSKGMASGKWGKNFRIEAVDSVKVNGDYYAKTFRIYLCADHSLSSASPNQLQDTQGRPIPSYTWMIGSDLPNQDYDNYKILNANSLSLAVQKAGVMMAGGAGEDVLTGGLGADTLIGGLDSDTLIGGDGSDTFVFAKDSGDIGGITGDVIKDFNFGKNGGVQADTISLYQLFDSRLVSQLGKGAVNDASTLSSYVKLEWTKLDNNLQMVCSVDQTGNSNFSKLFTMTDLIHSVGDGNFNQNQVDQTRLYGGETTSALLQKMLEEGRLVVQ
jgi:hypothetical protein